MMASVRSMRGTLLIFSIVAIAGFGCQATNDEVIEFERDVTVDDNEQVSRLLGTGKSYLDSDLYLQAEEAYRKVLRIDENNKTAIQNLSYTYRKQGRLDDAMAMDHKYVAKFPDDPNGHARLAAVEAEEMMDFDGAIGHMDAAIAINPDDATYYADRGFYAYSKQDDSGARTALPLALESYRKAEELDPENEDYGKYINKIIAEMDDPDMIAKNSLEELEEDPENPRLLRKVAKMYQDQEDWSSAASYYERLSAVDTGNAGVLQNLALIYLQIPDTTNAVRSYDRLVALDPTNVNGLVRLAELQASRSQRNYRDGITTVKKAIDLDPENARAWSAWGKALEYLEQYEEARAKFVKASTLNDPVWSSYAQQEIARQDQLIERREKLKEKAQYEANTGN
ncbi:MAG: hypothetical protein HKN20_03525 [Gemmatimonadetes bacterium]|nr:hypothetical protein [Gemmatimonadota bacterium]